MILPNGAVKIVDRVKNIFKLAQGEYIAPEKLENIYVQCSLIAQLFIYGDSWQSFIVAVVVVDPEVLKKWAVNKGHDTEHLEKWMHSNELKKDIILQMDQKAKECSLTGLEKVKKVHLTLSPFTIANDIVTPTFKLKRNVAKRVFQSEIDKMYEEGL